MMKSFPEVIRRFCSLALLACVGCAAQSSVPDIDRKIERQIRAYYSANIPPQVNVKIGPRKQSAEFPDYEEFLVTFDYMGRSQEQAFLLSKDGKTLARLTKIDMTKDPYAEVMSKIDVQGRPVRGNKDAKVTIVNYDDFQCPFCQRMHDTITNEILKTYGDKVKVIYKDYPLVEIHPWAKHAAVNANCLNQQNPSAYWAFADAIHSNARTISEAKGMDEQFGMVDKIALEEGRKVNMNSPQLQACIKAQKDDAVKASMAEATALGVEATPTLFVNGVKLDGAVPAADLMLIINRALADAGQTPPPSSQKAASGGK
jgi:protein-disulfide isomerase